MAVVSRPFLGCRINAARPLLRLLILIGLTTVLAGCLRVSEGGSASIGGSVQIDQAALDDPFFDPLTDALLIEADETTSEALDTFEPIGSAGEIIDGSTFAIGRLGELEVGRWEAEDGGRLACVGYRVGSTSTSSQCDPVGAAVPNPTVFFDVTCLEGDETPVWRVFTVDERVDALRVELADGTSVVGIDPEDAGLVALEATGEVRRSTAQTTTGQVWVLDFVASCQEIRPSG